MIFSVFTILFFKHLNVKFIICIIYDYLFESLGVNLKVALITMWNFHFIIQQRVRVLKKPDFCLIITWRLNTHCGQFCSHILSWYLANICVWLQQYLSLENVKICPISFRRYFYLQKYYNYKHEKLIKHVNIFWPIYLKIKLIKKWVNKLLDIQTCHQDNVTEFQWPSQNDPFTYLQVAIVLFF